MKKFSPRTLMNVVALISGFIFALGLALSGMVQPLKVVGFLDVTGDWNPALMFVMIGAISIHAAVYWTIHKKPKPLLGEAWFLPTKTEVTNALLIGSFLFGVGWALGGFCPGPAFVSLVSLTLRPALFISFMVIGMCVANLAIKYLKLKR